MIALRKLLRLVLPMVLLAAAPWTGYGQEASADQGKALLKQGIEEFGNLDFKAAKATLLKIQREFLSEDVQETLEGYLARADEAIKKQSAALEAYRSAEEALKAGDLTKAKEGFATAAASEYVLGSKRREARDQLALVENRIRAAELAARDRPKEEREPEGIPEPERATRPTDEAALQRVVTAAKERREQARQYLVRGNTAMKEGRYAQAAWFFKLALDLQPDLEEARRQLSYAGQFTATKGEPGILPRYIRKRRLLKKQTDVEFDKSMNRAQQTLDRADSEEEFQAAIDAVELAQETIETKKTLYTAEEYSQRMFRIRGLGDQIRSQQDEWARAQAIERQKEVERSVQDRIRREQAQKQRRIETETTRARTLVAEHNYDQALDLVIRILNIDPANVFALGQRDILEQMVLMKKEARADRTRNLQEQQSMVDLRLSEIPWYKLVMYPEDWKDLTLRREPFGVGADVPEEDRELRASLRKRVAQVNLRNINFNMAVDWLRLVGGLNIVVKTQALQAAGLDPALMDVDLPGLSNVTVEKVLELILEAGGAIPLAYVVDEGVITISTKDDLREKTFTRVRDIRDLIYRVPSVGQPTEFGLTEMDGGTGEGGVGGDGGGDGGLFPTPTQGQGEGAEGAAEEGMSRAELVQSIMDTIREVIDPLSWQPAGTTGALREWNGQLIVTQTAENHQAILDLINRLREARAIQIAIEARFISVSTGFLESIGIDLDFFFNIGSRLGSVYVTDPFTAARLDPALQPVSATRFGVSGWGTGPPGQEKLTPLPAVQSHITWAGGMPSRTPILSGTSITENPLPTALTVVGTFLDDIQVNFLLQATQAHADTRTLVAPRITLFNGQSSYIIVATQQAYVAELEPEVTENAVAFDLEIEEVSTGASLWVEATVSADRRYVTITVMPTVTNLVDLVFFPYDPLPLIAIGQMPPAEQAFVQLPILQVQTLQTTVSVPDGGTLLLGGQKLAAEVEQEMGVPVLSKIPIINRFFDNRNLVRDEQTLLILMKPKIIIQPEEEEKAFP